MTAYDSPWKEALEQYFEPFMALLFPKIHRAIDWSCGHEFLDKELQQVVGDADQGKRLADKLVRVWRRDGREAWVLIHVEVQSQEEVAFAQRMYVYYYRLCDRYDHDVVSLAVLGDDNPNWRPSRFERELWGCRLEFGFQIAKLLDFRGREQLLATSQNPFAAFALAHLEAMATRRDPLARRSSKVRLVKSLYERGFGRRDVLQLFRLIDWMMTLPEGLNEQFRDEIWRYQEEKRMPYITSIERLAMKEGRREGLLLGLEAFWKARFADESASVLEEVKKTRSFAKLEAVLKALEKGSSADEIHRLVGRTPRSARQ